jgi:cytoskeletal protein CcmA (bactofilin family)
MSFFRRETAGAASAAAAHPNDSPAAQRRRVTHIAPGTRVQGAVTGASELLIEGEVEGEIRIDSLVVVGAEGTVRGPITAQVVRVGGRVAGNVEAADRIEVTASGNVEGDMAAPRVIIAEGAFFKGRVEMRGNKGVDARLPKPVDARLANDELQKAPGEPGKA